MHPPTAVAPGFGAPFLPFPYPLRAAVSATGGGGDPGSRPGGPLTQLHPAVLPQYPFFTGPAAGMLPPGLRPAFLHQPPEKSKSFTIDAILGRGDKGSAAGRGEGRPGCVLDAEGSRMDDSRGAETVAGHPYLRSITCPTALRYGPGLDLGKGGWQFCKMYLKGTGPGSGTKWGGVLIRKTRFFYVKN